MIIEHPIPPLYDARSRVLILGSFPSVKSRESGFYYGHAQNRFWRVLAEVLGESTPSTVDEKKHLLLANNIALWDVIASCEITGSADSSIKNAVANDIGAILEQSEVSRIFVNGRAAKRLYDEFILPSTGRQAQYLPSTSPANATWSVQRLVGEWSIIKQSK